MRVYARWRFQDTLSAPPRKSEVLTCSNFNIALIQWRSIHVQHDSRARPENLAMGLQAAALVPQNVIQSSRKQSSASQVLGIPLKDLDEFPHPVLVRVLPERSLLAGASDCASLLLVVEVVLNQGSAFLRAAIGHDLHI